MERAEWCRRYAQINAVALRKVWESAIMGLPECPDHPRQESCSSPFMQSES